MVDIMTNEFKQATDILANKGFYTCNMVYNTECYELCDGDGKTVIDYLSEAQVIQLSAIL